MLKMLNVFWVLTPHARARFQSRYTIAIVYRLMFFMCRRVLRYTPRASKVGVSQDYARSMLLVSQLKLPSRSYRTIGGIAAILSRIVIKNANKGAKQSLEGKHLFESFWNPWAELKGAQNVPKSKISRGCPLEDRFWRPSESCF